ncbi:MAG: glycosyltransferase family 2 protein, partial [Candidatus Subteraquimicrobiales bacterium]|nr:glycosyltransferase family 2 protein [Candidatus Subteraquimicrobiales bacterium]
MNDDTPLVSVIIPSYNRAQFIERALNSVRAQTYDNLEMIVVDDASSDDTEERVAAMVLMDNRISYVRHLVNRGAQAARNTGVHKAKGDYIALLDSDN